MRGAVEWAGAAMAAVFAAGCWPAVLWYGKSPDRRQEVSVIQEGGGQRVRAFGRDGKVFEAIGIEAVVWSPDSRRIAYPARAGGGWKVVIDGVEGPVFSGIGEIVWSGDSRHVAYSAEQRGRWAVVRDGAVGPSFGALRARSLRWSADGAKMAYVAEQDGEVVAVIDGVKSAPFDAIGHLVLGARGRAGFIGRRGKESFVWVDGKEISAGEDVADLSFSPSGKRAVWIARRGEGWRVVEGEGEGERGRESEAFDRVSVPVWSAAGDRLAYSVGRKTVESVVVEGVIGAGYEGVMPGSLTFDRSGNHTSYAARRKGVWYAVVDGVEQAPFEGVEAPVFVGESAAVAYVARRGATSFVVVDDHQGPVCDAASQLVVSPDGRRYLHAARAGAQVAVLEGEIQGGPCGQGRCKPVLTRAKIHDVVMAGTLVFSDDGEHTGYLAGRASEQSLFLVIDGKRAAELDMAEVMAQLVQDPDLAGALTGDSKRLGQWVKAEAALAAGRREGSPGTGRVNAGGASRGGANRGDAGAH